MKSIWFPQSTSMKVREEGRDVKAANKLLREVDLEETDLENLW